MSGALLLSCWVQGDDPGHVFYLDIAGYKTVSHLKDEIKKKKHIFRDIDADALKIWKVDIMEKDFADTLKDLKLEDGVAGVERLTMPLKRLSKVFSRAVAPNDEHLDIVVERPTGAEGDPAAKRKHTVCAESDSAEFIRDAANTKRRWTVDGAIRSQDIRRCYFLDPMMQEENKRCLDAVQHCQFVMLSGARASGKTTRLFRLQVQLEEMGYRCLYVSFEGLNYMSGTEVFWVSFGLAIRRALGEPSMKPPCTQETFLDSFAADIWNQNVVLLVDEFSELYRAHEDVKNNCFRVFREIRNNNAMYAIRSIIVAGTFSILRLNPTNSSIYPFNVSDSVQAPYFSVEETRALFHDFAQDNGITIDDDVVNDVWAKSNGHPGMVCLCGYTISNNIALLLDDNSRTLSYNNWKRFPVERLRGQIYSYNTFRSMIVSLRNPKSEVAVKLLRSKFAGFLDGVTLQPDDENLGDLLTAEGVLLRPDINVARYCMASPLIDELIRTRIIPFQCLNAPSMTPPLRDTPSLLCVLDTLIESLKFFDKDLIRAANSHSYKSSTVRVGGRDHTPVPRESVYDTELMGILEKWLGYQYAWTVTGQWHLGTALGKHKYTDITLQKDIRPPIVLELLATGDPKSVKSHIENTPEHMDLVSANEGWVVHFTCEDDYRPIWQSDAALDKGVNVVHFWHDLNFTRLWMWARWKDDAGNTILDDCNLDI